MKTIVVQIDPMGNTKIEALGFNGVGCEQATKALEERLGGGEVVRETKPEFYQEELTEQQRMTW